MLTFCILRVVRKSLPIYDSIPYSSNIVTGFDEIIITMAVSVFLVFLVAVSMGWCHNHTQQTPVEEEPVIALAAVDYIHYCQKELSDYKRDCREIYEKCDNYEGESGVYTIQPSGSAEPFRVYCNNSVDGGGWTVIQRRLDGSVDFYRTWNEYKNGFGFLAREFWLGNDKITDLTNQQGDYEVRIDMNNVNGVPYFAKYNLFRISDEWSKYKLILGDYMAESTAERDPLSYHNNMAFSTYDRDNDNNEDLSCSENHRGAWWYNRCDYSDLNSNYFANPGDDASIEWTGLPGGSYNLKFTEIKIRPL